MLPHQTLKHLAAASLVALPLAAQSTPPDAGERVVTATRKRTLLEQTPGTIQVVTRKEIEALHPINTGQLLDFIAGATRETGTGSGHPKRSIIGLNGLPANYTLVLVDGVRLLTEHIHTGQNLELIPPHLIERIEIIRGAAAAQYGTDAIGGVVNIILRKANDRGEGEVRMAGGSYRTWEAGASWFGPVGSKARLSLFTGREMSDGFPIKAPASRVGRTGYRRDNVMARLDAQVGERSEAFAWIHRIGTSMDWQQSTTDASLASGAVGFTTPLGAQLELQGQASYGLWKAQASAEQNELIQPELRLVWRLSERQSLSGGVEHMANTFTRSKVLPHPRQDTLGAYLQHDWRPNTRITLLSALRYDRVQDVASVFTPMVSAVWSLDAQWRLRASVARGFHAPSPMERYEEGYGHGGRALRFGNPDLRPEYSSTTTLGLEGSPAPAVDLMFLAFESRIDDMIVPVYEGPWAKDPSKDVWRRANIASALVRGTEVKARYQPSSRWRVEAGYSQSTNQSQDRAQKLPYDPGKAAFVKGHLAGSGTGWQASAFLGLRAVYGRSAWNWKPPTGSTAAAGLTTPLKNYQDVEAGASWQFGRHFRLDLSLRNLLGQDFENLDDAWTVTDGKPNATLTLAWRW